MGMVKLTHLAIAFMVLLAGTVCAQPTEDGRGDPPTADSPPSDPGPPTDPDGRGDSVPSVLVPSDSGGVDGRPDGTVPGPIAELVQLPVAPPANEFDPPSVPVPVTIEAPVFDGDAPAAPQSNAPSVATPDVDDSDHPLAPPVEAPVASPVAAPQEDSPVPEQEPIAEPSGAGDDAPTSPPSAAAQPGSNINAEPDFPIVGLAVGIVSAVLFIALIILLFVLYRRRQKRQQDTDGSAPTAVAAKKPGAAAKAPKQDEYSPLEQVILSNELLVADVAAATQATEADDLAKSFVLIYGFHHRSVPLINDFITKEVDTSSKANTLFRVNSMATKLMKSYSTTIGVTYLRTVLGPHINKLIDDGDSLEVDPDKGGNEANVKLLSAKCDALLKTVFDSVDSIPEQLFPICAHLMRTVGSKFPEAQSKAVAGFLFLRFIAPAIVSPDGFGVVDREVPKPVRRALVLVSKIIQQLANETKFGSKEAFMVPFNKFIKAHSAELAKFYSLIKFYSDMGRGANEASNQFTPERRRGALELLHLQLTIVEPKLTEANKQTVALLLDKLGRDVNTKQFRKSAKARLTMHFG